MPITPNSHADQLAQRAVREYDDWVDVSDPDNIDDAEASAADTLIGTLIALVKEETGLDITEGV